MSLPAFTFGHRSICAYCGDIPVGRDHVIPVAFQTSRKKARFTAMGPTTWSCQHCNSKLNDRVFDTFRDRCEWVRNQLERKARPVLWHEWEYEKVDYTVRTFVIAEQNKRKWWRFRADFYQSREYYLNLESLQWLVKDIDNAFLSSFFAPTIAELQQQIYHEEQ